MKRKSDIITFKADPTLLEAMQGITNRSSFIRSAILAALDNVCPLCTGAGILTPNQRQHWDTFHKNHAVKECNHCNELYLVCSRESAGRKAVSKTH